MSLQIFTDGGSKGNPGQAAIGIVFYRGSKEILSYREDIGITTNNVAEYTAVIRALELLKKNLPHFTFPVLRIEFYSDSLLLVNQLIGIYKVKKAHIGELILTIRGWEQVIGLPILYHHIPREKNKRADSLVNGG